MQRIEMWERRAHFLVAEHERREILIFFRSALIAAVIVFGIYRAASPSSDLWKST
jgi:hypothetical protein